MKRKDILLGAAAMQIVAACAGGRAEERPNVLLIVADDLGMGDVSAYGSTTISTPNIDSLALRGIRFQNGYSASATSTPSRYAMLTGCYPWKNPDAKILPGDAPLLIPEDAPTLPKMFRAAGYSTAAIGKWHLGMGRGKVDWNSRIEPSANSVGFDYTNVIAATNDRVPTVYVRNGEVVGLDPSDPIHVSYDSNFEGEPTALTHPQLMKMSWDHGHWDSMVNGIPRIGFMKGGESARWKDEDMADYFLSEVKGYLDTIPSDKPFFLYYGLHQPHVPRAPHQRFAGVTGLGPRGDAVAEADWCVGQLMEYLRGKGLLENTLIIFTSDNGAVLQDGYADLSEELALEKGHDPDNGMRGGKYSLYDAGCHIPLLVCWDGHIEPKVSDALFTQLDFYGSLAGLVGQPVPEGLDTEDYCSVMLGRSEDGRKEFVGEAQSRLNYRKGNYVLIPPYEGPVSNNDTGIELGNVEDYALYDLSSDPSQMTDIAGLYPEIVSLMIKELENKKSRP